MCGLGQRNGCGWRWPSAAPNLNTRFFQHLTVRTWGPEPLVYSIDDHTPHSWLLVCWAGMISFFFQNEKKQKMRIDEIISVTEEWQKRCWTAILSAFRLLSKIGEHITTNCRTHKEPLKIAEHRYFQEHWCLPDRVRSSLDSQLSRSKYMQQPSFCNSSSLPVLTTVDTIGDNFLNSRTLTALLRLKRAAISWVVECPPLNWKVWRSIHVPLSESP